MAILHNLTNIMNWFSFYAVVYFMIVSTLIVKNTDRLDIETQMAFDHVIVNAGSTAGELPVPETFRNKPK